MGYYAANISIKKTNGDQNTIDIKVKVYEGKQARIRDISFYGNRDATPAAEKATIAAVHKPYQHGQVMINTQNKN